MVSKSLVSSEDCSDQSMLRDAGPASHPRGDPVIGDDRSLRLHIIFVRGDPMMTRW